MVLTRGSGRPVGVPSPHLWLCRAVGASLLWGVPVCSCLPRRLPISLRSCTYDYSGLPDHDVSVVGVAATDSRRNRRVAESERQVQQRPPRLVEPKLGNAAQRRNVQPTPAPDEVTVGVGANALLGQGGGN